MHDGAPDHELTAREALAPAREVQRRDDGARPEKRDVTLVKYSFLSDKTIASSMGKRPYVGGMRVDYASVIVHASRIELVAPLRRGP